MSSPAPDANARRKTRPTEGMLVFRRLYPSNAVFLFAEGPPFSEAQMEKGRTAGERRAATRAGNLEKASRQMQPSISSPSTEPPVTQPPAPPALHVPFHATPHPAPPSASAQQTPPPPPMLQPPPSAVRPETPFFTPTGRQPLQRVNAGVQNYYPDFSPGVFPSSTMTPLRTAFNHPPSESLTPTPSHPAFNPQPSESTPSHPGPPTSRPPCQAVPQADFAAYFQTLSDADRHLVFASLGVLKESVPAAGDLSGVDFDLNMDFGDVGAGKHRHITRDCSNFRAGWTQIMMVTVRMSHGLSLELKAAKTSLHQELRRCFRQMNIRAVQPAYQAKQGKRKQMAVRSDSDSAPDLGAAKPPPKKKKNQKSRSIKTIDENLHAILDVAFSFLKIDLTHFLPWPRVGVPSGPASQDNNEIDTLLLKAFDAACEERGIDDVVECPEAALQLMRSRIPQFRAGLKELAQQRVVDTFDFVDLQKLEDPTPERIAECIAKNRERVVTLEKSFRYQDPYNTNIPNTMYRNKIIPALFSGYWFGPRSNNRAYYFRGLTRVSFITIALIMSAILCAVREWSTGRWVLVKFEAREFLQPYC
ncbi:hypothetical protein C8J57DRAFT_1713723 [Mycena rebaudengoi]|nr:hypothetical protein C8J57DRAFT_1713723 [Mycena rebaudengoi]